MAISIYALCDPDTDAIHYVGQATDCLARLRGHLKHPAPKVAAWLAELGGRTPALRILEETTKGEAEAKERFWIRYLSQRGCRLLNTVGLPDEEPQRTAEQLERNKRSLRTRRLRAYFKRKRARSLVDRPASPNSDAQSSMFMRASGTSKSGKIAFRVVGRYPSHPGRETCREPKVAGQPESQVCGAATTEFPGPSFERLEADSVPIIHENGPVCEGDERCRDHGHPRC